MAKWRGLQTQIERLKEELEALPKKDTKFFSENAVTSGNVGSYLYPEDSGGGLFLPTRRASSIPLTRQARGYLEVLSTTLELAQAIIGRLALEIHRAEAEGRPVVCVLLSPDARRVLTQQSIALGWGNSATIADVKTFMGYETLIEPGLAKGDYLVVTV